MTKINYSCYWHTNKLGYREIRGYQPWNTPIAYPIDKVVAKYHRLYDRLYVIEELLYDLDLYEVEDCGSITFAYNHHFFNTELDPIEMSLLNDYEEYSYKLATFNVDIKAILDDLITSTPSY
mgnify:CR=1 FL=1